MSGMDHRPAAPAQPPRVNWKRVSLAVVAAGILLVGAANAHLVYVAVASQPDCALGENDGGQTVKFQAAKAAC